MDLMRVQEAALQNGRGKPGFAYFCEMGLGKTLIALTEFKELVDQRAATRLVVVCPNSFKSGWVAEIEKHGFDFRTFIFESGNDASNDAFIKEKYTKAPVLIINYEALRKEYTQTYIRYFVGQRGAMLVLDESIQIKTYDSQQTKAALALSTMFKYRRVLSGKPITQGPHDLWAQMRAIGAINTKYFPFKTTYCQMGGYKGKKVVGTQNEELLASLIDRFIFRASKKDWTDLPPKLYTSREYKLTPYLLSKYKSMEEEFVVWLNDTENVTVDTFITKYIKLAQIQSGFIIREDGSIEELVKPEDNPRFNLVKEIIEEANGKVIVPYIHRYTLGLLQRALADYNPAFIKGMMEQSEIEEQKRRFNNDNGCRAILVQTRAGKYGHTLLGDQKGGDKCSTMVFAENSYSLDDRSQIEDRMHRHGQTAEHCLYVDVWGTPLDRRMTAALQAKENVAQAAFQFFKDHHSAFRSRPN